MPNPQLSPTELPARRTRWAWWLSTFFGIGWLRPGPGTYASIAATMLWLLLIYSNAGTAVVFVTTASLAVITTIVGIASSAIVARESGIGDPGFVVIDEAAGTWSALLAACLPFAGWRPSLPSALAALLLFRLFDIWKPWPVSALDRMHGGTGIMLDDIAAGAYAFAVVVLLRATHLLH